MFYAYLNQDKDQWCVYEECGLTSAIKSRCKNEDKAHNLADKLNDSKINHHVEKQFEF